MCSDWHLCLSSPRSDSPGDWGFCQPSTKTGRPSEKIRVLLCPRQGSYIVFHPLRKPAASQKPLAYLQDVCLPLPKRVPRQAALHRLSPPCRTAHQILCLFFGVRGRLGEQRKGDRFTCTKKHRRGLENYQGSPIPPPAAFKGGLSPSGDERPRPAPHQMQFGLSSLLTV